MKERNAKIKRGVEFFIQVYSVSTYKNCMLFYGEVYISTIIFAEFLLRISTVELVLWSTSL